MRIHFIAIGGAAMHNLAIALDKNGYEVSGSDDEIKEPSLSKLRSSGLLPEVIGWDPQKINQSLDAIILGMHARADNPELIKAQELGLKIYSYPEFIYEQSKDKIRVVIGGSHGKTTITAMILHVLKSSSKKFDYMVGSKLEGYDTMVKLSNEAKYIILEGDEYLSSPIDKRPKFHLYKAHIGLISGIAWDHINVFPTFEEYVTQFRVFIQTIMNNGALVYFENDTILNNLVSESNDSIDKIPYKTPTYKVENGITYLQHDGKNYSLRVFGEHNLQNIEAARCICLQLGIKSDQFYKSISTFGGAARRMEMILDTSKFKIIRDFAHSPSKVEATVKAVKSQFSSWNVIACMELHTFSSLNMTFLNEYENSLDNSDLAVVYYNPKTIEHKKLVEISTKDVKKAFNREDLKVYSESSDFQFFINNLDRENTILLMMSSGTFDDIQLSPK